MSMSRYPDGFLTITAPDGTSKRVWGTVHTRRRESDVGDFGFGDVTVDVTVQANADIRGSANPGDMLTDRNGTEWRIADVLPADDRYSGYQNLQLQRDLGWLPPGA